MKLSKLLGTNNSARCIPLEGDKSLALPGNIVESLVSPSCDPKEIVLQLKENLRLNKMDLKQPTPEATRTIRCLAAKAKESNRVEVVKHLREITPAGTTGEFTCSICGYQLLHSSINEWFSPDAIAALLVYKTKEKRVFGVFDLIIMQNI